VGVREWRRNKTMKQNQTSIYRIARELRQKTTETEKILWNELRGNKLGIKFRRQSAFILGKYRYVADFYCHDKKLIIEIDGGYHNEEEMKELDKFREEVFDHYSYKVIRFTNKEIKNNIDLVINKIKNEIID